MYKPKERMTSIEPVGNYALRIAWNDGHNTGIYSYDHLRSICPCAACQAATHGRKRRNNDRMSQKNSGRRR